MIRSRSPRSPWGAVSLRSSSVGCEPILHGATYAAVPYLEPFLNLLAPFIYSERFLNIKGYRRSVWCPRHEKFAGSRTVTELVHNHGNFLAMTSCKNIVQESCFSGS